MDHARLRAAAGKSRAALSILKQGGFPIESAVSVALEALSDVAEAVASGSASQQAPDDNVRQLNLGEIIDMLEAWPDQGEACRFDFGFLAPTSTCSYRGFYEQLAICFGSPENYPAPTVSDVLEMLKQAVGREYTGWKGGEFVMSRSTPVWVALSGETSGTVIVGHYKNAHVFVFKTAYID